MGFTPEMEPDFFFGGNENEVIDAFQQEFMNHYNEKNRKIAEHLLPTITDVYNKVGNQFKRIALPYSDGSSHPVNLSAELADAVNTGGRSIARDVEKTITLAIIDDKWKEHLRQMDDLKDAVQGASFEQKDPLVIYKMEAFKLFEELIHKINHDVTAYLSKGNIMVEIRPDEVREARRKKTDFSKARVHKDDSEGYDDSLDQEHMSDDGQPVMQKPQTFIRSEKKIGRNDPCPCGSGKKYKNCHGAV